MSSNKQENHPVQASELARTGWFGFLRLVLAEPNIHIISYANRSHASSIRPAADSGHAATGFTADSYLLLLCSCVFFDSTNWSPGAELLLGFCNGKGIQRNINTIAVTNNPRMMEDRAALLV